ncbi:MAG: DUF1801 domain-containing protein [bacterium]
MLNKTAKTVDEYLDSLSDASRAEISAVRDVVLRSLPKGYVEGMEYGMIYYSIPLSRYPETYNGHPLCYVGLAAQKNHNAIYLMGVYGDGGKAKQFKDAFASAGKKLDIGKSCVRFKSASDLALDAIADSIASIPVDAFIAMYERSRTPSQRKSAKKTAGKSASPRKT